jgi:beta-mannosidase
MAKFRRTGIVWWNLRDGWPIISDAVVDFYGNRKLAYAYINRAQRDDGVMIGDAPDGTHPVVAVDDTLAAKSGTVRVRDVDSGQVLLDTAFSLPANGRVEISRIPDPAKQQMWSIEYTIGNQHFRSHYLAGRPPFRLADYRRWFDALHLGAD